MYVLSDELDGIFILHPTFNQCHSHQYWSSKENNKQKKDLKKKKFNVYLNTAELQGLNSCSIVFICQSLVSFLCYILLLTFYLKTTNNKTCIVSQVVDLTQNVGVVTTLTHTHFIGSFEQLNCSMRCFLDRNDCSWTVQNRWSNATLNPVEKRHYKKLKQNEPLV